MVWWRGMWLRYGRCVRRVWYGCGRWFWHEAWGDIVLMYDDLLESLHLADPHSDAPLRRLTLYPTILRPTILLHRPKLYAPPVYPLPLHQPPHSPPLLQTPRLSLSLPQNFQSLPYNFSLPPRLNAKLE